MDSLYVLVARHLEGEANRLQMQVDRMKALSRELLEAQGNPGKLRATIDTEIAALVGYAETLPKGETERV